MRRGGAGFLAGGSGSCAGPSGSFSYLVADVGVRRFYYLRELVAKLHRPRALGNARVSG